MRKPFKITQSHIATSLGNIPALHVTCLGRDWFCKSQEAMIKTAHQRKPCVESFGSRIMDQKRSGRSSLGKDPGFVGGPLNLALSQPGEPVGTLRIKNRRY